MSEAIKIEVSGLRELQARASKLNQKMERRSYSRAVRAASKPVLASAISKAPGRTGTLKKSIKARANNKPSQFLFGVKLTVVGGSFSSGKTARRRGAGSVYQPDESLRYYRFQELGTKHHRAQAFLEPALDASAGKFLSILKSELAREIELNARTP